VWSPRDPGDWPSTTAFRSVSMVAAGLTTVMWRLTGRSNTGPRAAKRSFLVGVGPVRAREVLAGVVGGDPGAAPGPTLDPGEERETTVAPILISRCRRVVGLKCLSDRRGPFHVPHMECVGTERLFHRLSLNSQQRRRARGVNVGVESRL